MNLRTYIRLFQPIPAVLMTVVMANGAAGFGLLLSGLSESDSRLLALLTAVPFLLGMDLAAAAHTALHRPFSLLLPDALERLQPATLWAALACDLAVTLLVGWFFPAVPAAAVFGFVAPLLLLPCFNRRRLVTRPGVFNISVNIAGLQFHLLGILGWAAFMKLAGQRLVPAMQAAPWLFFVGGLAASGWLLRLAFSRESLRERAETPFISPNAAWRLVFSPKIIARHQEETRRHIARFGADSTTGKLAARPGRDWTVRSVGPRTRDWLQVHWHAAYGAMRNGSFLRAQGQLLLVMLVSALAFPLFGYLFALIENRPLDSIDYLGSLAAVSSLEFGQPSSPLHGAISFMGAFFTITFAFALTLASQLRPQLPYPVSRERLARVGFAHAILQLMFALLVPTVAVTVVSLLGQITSGQFGAALGLPPLLELNLILAPLLPLAATAGRLRHPVARLTTLIAISIVGIGIMVFHSRWTDLIATPLGLLGTALSSVAAVLLLRWQIRHHFLTCDLIAEAAEAKPFVLAASATFSRTPAPAAT